MAPRRTRLVCLLLLAATASGCRTGDVARVHGLTPTDPPAALEPAVVDSLTPTLRWQRARGCAYDVIVMPFRALDPDEPGYRRAAAMYRVDHKTVYYREGLARAEHAVETPLDPDTVYLWSVRTRMGAPVRLSAWSTFDGRRALRDEEKERNQAMRTADTIHRAPLFFLDALASLGGSPGSAHTWPDRPDYATGEDLELEHLPFSFRTPPMP